MKAFQYATALTPASARELAGDRGCYIAGGNDLLGLMKEYIAEPDLLVNIKSLPGLNRITPGEERWILGANVKVAEIEAHPGLKQKFPALTEAAAEVGSPQIRNVATLGGNLAQHSRCWYFRQRDVFCLKKGGDTCFARNGENKYHSLFTGNTCISPVVSNLAVALGALEATVVVQREDELARWSIDELYAKAWDNPTAHHSLASTDLILQVEIPVAERRSAYLQTSEKSQFDWALASCAASAKIIGGKLAAARVVLGAVSPVPYQVKAVGKLLEGREMSTGLAEEAADLLLKKASPLEHNAYKVPLAKALVQRTLLKLGA
jgi:xanthine dehydrogenase YagS FAD-binding subunit